SVPTAILLIRLIPQVVNIPGPAVLRAANEALIEQTKLLSLIVTSMGDGLLVVDRDGAALLSNPALRRMLGLKEDEDVPKNCSQDCGFFRTDKVTRIAPAESPTSRAVAGGLVNDEEIFIQHRGNVDGSWADVTARALRDEHGTIHGAVAVFHDVPRINGPKNSSEICCGNGKPEQKPRLRTARRTGFLPCSAMSCGLRLHPSLPVWNCSNRRSTLMGNSKAQSKLFAVTSSSRRV